MGKNAAYAAQYAEEAKDEDIPKCMDEQIKEFFEEY